MGPTFVDLALSLTLLTSPQDPPPAAEASTTPEALLGANEIKSLNGKAQKWFATELEYERATANRERQAARRALDKEKSAFMKEWETRSKKGELLASMPDLEAIFRDAFPYPRQPGLTGEVRTTKAKDGSQFAFCAPKTYREAGSYPTVLLLPGFDEGKSAWVDPRDHFAATWKGVPKLEHMLLVIPEVDDAIELDVMPDYSQPDAFEKERQRITAVLDPAGQFQREYNVDRNRLFVDSGKGACGFALRLASYFPSRFAGMVLRAPVDVDMRYESLHGLPMLLISDAESKQACDAIAQRLNRLSEGACTVLEGKGSYPFTASGPEIADWMAARQRTLYPTKVVIGPNHDLFKRAYWVSIGTAEPLDSVAKENRPYIEAVVDRAANKITITTKSVSDFALFLNDAIVDLDQDITFVVNGVAQKQKRDRSFSYMIDRMLRLFDPTMIFTAEFTTSVPN